MIIGVVGLGLIGGSIAGAIKENTDFIVYGYDISNDTLDEALKSGYIDNILNDSMISQCDVIIIALYPKATINYVLTKSDLFKKDSVIVDCSGVKTLVCREIWEKTKNCDFVFIGGHPMAGKQYSGFKHASPTLFKNASMILTPPDGDNYPDVLNTIFNQIGCTIKISTPEEHDKIIAFTSQLAHVVSNSYIKSETAEQHHGYSAGSYRDLTRVALLNPDMWTELFMANAENLSKEIDVLIQNLNDISDAIKSRDENKLYELLNSGSERKKKVDNLWQQ